MKKVYICSPLRGNYEKNIKSATLYCRGAIKAGYIPIAPHIYFPRFLDDTNETEREIGLKCGLEALEGCDEIWVFYNTGERPSEGMWGEITKAAELGIPIYGFDAKAAYRSAFWEKWEQIKPFARVHLIDDQKDEQEGAD